VFRDIRYRYNLHCTLCGLSVTRRAEVLYPVLDRLVASGVDAVSIRALGALR
jgi:hypothetical protein